MLRGSADLYIRNLININNCSLSIELMFSEMNCHTLKTGTALKQLMGLKTVIWKKWYTLRIACTPPPLPPPWDPLSYVCNCVSRSGWILRTFHICFLCLLIYFSKSIQSWKDIDTLWLLIEIVRKVDTKCINFT